MQHGNPLVRGQAEDSLKVDIMELETRDVVEDGRHDGQADGATEGHADSYEGDNACPVFREEAYAMQRSAHEANANRHADEDEHAKDGIRLLEIQDRKSVV